MPVAFRVTESILLIMMGTDPASLGACHGAWLGPVALAAASSRLAIGKPVPG